jgi:hypothetical protein
MTKIGPESITFDLTGDAARITRRAAEQLHLRILDLPDGSFRVLLRTPIDAYELGQITASDPAWARLMLEHRS